jgi:hypothetical protein
MPRSKHDLLGGIKDLNESVVLFPPPSEANVKIGDRIVLIVRNESTEPVVFPYNYGVKIFMKKTTANRFREIEELSNYTSKAGIGLNIAGSDMSNVRPISFRPDYPKTNSPIHLIILVCGHKYRNDTISKDEVCAYATILALP